MSLCDLTGECPRPLGRQDREYRELSLHNCKVGAYGRPLDPGQTRQWFGGRFGQKCGPHAMLCVLHAVQQRQEAIFLDL